MYFFNIKKDFLNHTIKLLVIVSFFNSKLLFAQNYENVQYVINVSNKVIGKKILKTDTLFILNKTPGSKYVDSLKITSLKKDLYYYFSLPDSLPDGKYSIYYNDKKQNICFIVSYKNGKRNGSFKFFNYNQTVREVGFYKNNCFDKIRIEYNKNGLVMGIYNYANCLLNGSSTTFYLSGEFNNIVNYKNGKKDGQFIQYNYDSLKYPNIVYDLEYKDGVLIKKN